MSFVTTVPDRVGHFAHLKTLAVFNNGIRTLPASIAGLSELSAEALVQQYQGTVKNNQGAVEAAKLNLDFPKIRAPIAGRLGLRQLDVGNLLAANDSQALVVITQTQPISVAFTLPECRMTPPNSSWMASTP